MQRLTKKQTAHHGVGIVHLGLGAFFRAHGAIYIAEAMQRSGGDWGICAASLRSPGIRDALQPQNFAYTALQAGPDGDSSQCIEVIDDLLVAPEDPAKLLAVMSDVKIKIVSLTVTEKGYCHLPASGSLNLEHPDIVHDLANAAPRSAIGFLVRALAARRAAGLRPFTVLSCDNLPHNGALVKHVVVDFAEQLDPDLAAWIATECRFPATMVDRIVPATKAEDIARVERITGYHDASPVIHEPFRQWVVEDNFVDQQRPDFAAVGVQMVSDVAPFELMKLRMLNGTHSSLAYLGYLAGFKTISAAVADPVLKHFVRKLWQEEIIPTLDAPEGTDLGQYADQLMARYENPAIQHLTWQIAMDGSQKLPQRVLATIQDAAAQGRDCPGLSLVMAAWMRYVSAVDEAGEPIDVQDPLATAFKAHATQAKNSAEYVNSLLSVRDIFSDSMAEQLKPAVNLAYECLLAAGAHRTAQEYYPA